MLKIKRALISVSDKTGIVDLAKTLNSFGVEIVSTGGTAKILKNAGIPVIEMTDYTGFPEMLDGRVKTLHPKIHAGLLSLRDNPEHARQIEKHGIGLIDMVVVNLYPFEETAKKENVLLAEAVENIDIGGPSMLRSAAKNYKSVAVVSSPKFYSRILSELKEQEGCLTDALLRALAIEVFKLTSLYDAAIFTFLDGNLNPQGREGDLMSDFLSLSLAKVASLRYGENPHQKAALYKDPQDKGPSLVSARQLHGKALSFNNYLDLSAALDIIRGFAGPAACIVKHTNPTGVAQSRTLQRSYEEAWASDPLSAFGGIIGLNRKVDAKTAKAILKSGFMECVLAPGYEFEALALFKTKKNLRLLEVFLGMPNRKGRLDFKKIDGGILLQEEDTADFKKEDLKFVTKRKPTKKELASLFFAWDVVRHVKSNAIVLARATKTVGIGMGQTSRIDSIFMAIRRAGKKAAGAVLASDAFLPKADNIALAKKAGIKAIIQPGGSIADEELILAADRAKIAMVFTGWRHFKH
jgi:phosphoribosylaminoimidazolecarboxamide formyltransferase/IMP cyclohydrolase